MFTLKKNDLIKEFFNFSWNLEKTVQRKFKKVKNWIDNKRTIQSLCRENLKTELEPQKIVYLMVKPRVLLKGFIHINNCKWMS